ncbi:hypothetical protein HC031_08525 [Planosporangium thailandense]|uniref:Uncharacterized protein n=1 Tax=Planosporangium thailandense TaxID=765197 RepID=A0ABX0XUR8_9ACTN|nr:hypothetical protein [Planosporangium thailandense]NJC69764.1 hypothetical protein [Planosporangium thailandense]
MRVDLEAWLIEDGKIEPLRKGDTLVCGVEIAIEELAPLPVGQPHRVSLLDAERFAYEVAGRPLHPDWLGRGLWVVEAEGIQFWPATPGPMPPAPASEVRIVGPLSVPWQHVGGSPLARQWRVTRILRESTEVDHIARWPDARRYALDLETTAT